MEDDEDDFGRAQKRALLLLTKFTALAYWAGTDSGFRSSGHPPGAGHRNFRLALANYAGEAGLNGKRVHGEKFRVVFFDIATKWQMAQELARAARRRRRGVDCRESAIHPARRRSERDGPPSAGKPGQGSN